MLKDRPLSPSPQVKGQGQAPGRPPALPSVRPSLVCPRRPAMPPSQPRVRPHQLCPSALPERKLRLRVPDLGIRGKARPGPRAPAAPTLPAGEEGLAGAREGLPASMLPARACPPPPAGRGPWQPGSAGPTAPTIVSILAHLEDERKRRTRSSPRGFWEFNGGGGARRGGPREWLPASPRDLTPAQGWTNLGHQSLLQGLLTGGPGTGPSAAGGSLGPPGPFDGDGCTRSR